MIVLKIIGIVLAVILLIIAIALCLPVDVFIAADNKNGLKLLYRFLGKMYGEEPDPNNVIRVLKRRLVYHTLAVLRL